MTSIAFVSTKGAPGVTTSTLAIASAWRTGSEPLVAEVDIDGGDMAAMCGLSLEGAGLLTLSVAGRRGDAQVDALSHCQLFGGAHLPLLCAPEQPQKVAQSLDMLGNRLLPTLAAGASTVFLDTGRLRPSEATGTLLTEVDLIVLVARPTVAQAAAIEGRASILNSFGPRVCLLLVGEEPYGADEFANAVGFETVGVLPNDQRGASALVESAGSMRRSLLMRSASDVARAIGERLSSAKAVR